MKIFPVQIGVMRLKILVTERKKYIYQFTCYSCGKCVKEKEDTTHICCSEHIFDKTNLKERTPNPIAELLNATAQNFAEFAQNVQMFTPKLEKS